MAGDSRLMEVKDVMVTDVAQISKDKTIKDAAEILRSKGIGCIVVTESGKTVGIVTERDIIHKVVAVDKEIAKTFVKDVMTSDVISLGESNSVEEAVDLMEEKNIKKLPIVDGDRLIGIVTMTDLVRTLRKIEKAMLERVTDKMYS
jgi:CBS domain-containing protein